MKRCSNFVIQMCSDSNSRRLLIYLRVEKLFLQMTHFREGEENTEYQKRKTQN